VGLSVDTVVVRVSSDDVIPVVSVDAVVSDALVEMLSFGCILEP